VEIVKLKCAKLDESYCPRESESSDSSLGITTSPDGGLCSLFVLLVGGGGWWSLRAAEWTIYLLRAHFGNNQNDRGRIFLAKTKMRNNDQGHRQHDTHMTNKGISK
jgi:hypothetical protein